MPVPAEEFVQIVFHEELTEQKTIEIADISGKIVATQVIQPGSTSASIDISALSSGLYLMTVRSENSDLAEKSKLIKR
jgi:hypothetical protein